MNYEIQQLRESQMQMNAPVQPGMPPAPQAYAPAPGPLQAPEPQPAQVPITLVMQNGAKVSVNNYAVMNDVIWDFSKQPARKISVSTINVPASKKLLRTTAANFPRLVQAVEVFAQHVQRRLGSHATGSITITTISDA